MRVLLVQTGRVVCFIVRIMTTVKEVHQHKQIKSRYAAANTTTVLTSYKVRFNVLFFVLNLKRCKVVKNILL